jgi:hypothetical protein
MEQHHSGEILGLLSALDEYWGAVQHDLMAARWRLSDLGILYGIDELADFVLNAGPTTAVFHQLTEGYGVGERLSARCLDSLNMLLWAESEDARKPVSQQRHRPKPTWVPGMEIEEPEVKEFEVMTIEDYMQRSGLA